MNTLTKMAQVGQESFAASVIAASLAYLAPMTEVFIVLLVFVAFDLVSGILASRKGQIPCSSRRLRQSIVKLISYISVMLLVYAAERAFDLEWLSSYRFLGGFICFVELISILENLAILTEKQIFLKIIKIIRGKAAEKHGSMIEDIFNEKNEEK